MSGLSITALYTSQVWLWGGVAGAELCATPEAKRVFDVTNAALALARKPPLRYALLHRHAMIDHLLAQGAARHVIELAAGLSPRGATAAAGGARVTEVDLPAMSTKKRELLARTVEGREALAKMSLVEGDVTAIDLAQLVAREPTFVIVEGLAMYLPGEARRALFANVRALAEATGELRFVFDLVPADEEPPPGLTGRALGAAMRAFTGGQDFERDARTRAQILGELAAAGFEAAEAIDARAVARTWHLPHAERETTMVVFSARARSSRA